MSTITPEFSRPERWRRRFLVGILLIALTLGAYGRVWRLGFVNIDDQPYVTENPHVLAGIGWSGIGWAFSNTKESYWHPLTWLSLMLDVTIGGADPRVYHTTNLLLHVTNTLLLFFLLDRLTGFRGRSAFVAALFAVHPLHVESVAWIVERKDVLSTLLLLLTVGAYARYTARRSPGRYALVLAAFGLGLTAKPMLVTLPLVLLLLDYWPLRRWGVKPTSASSCAQGSVGRDGAAEPRRIKPEILPEHPALLFLEKSPLLVLAGLSSLITLAAKGAGVKPLEEYPFGERVANALVSYVIYIRQTIVPRHLAALYPYPHGAIPLWQPAAAAIALVAVSVAAIALARRHPWLPVGWFWYLITLVPVIGLVQAGLQARADRYTYVPLIGLFIVVAWGVPELLTSLASRRSLQDGFRQARLLAAGAIAIVLALAAMTWVQVGYWRSGIDLLTHAIEATRDNAIAHNDLAVLLAARGDVDQAVSHLHEALRISPRYAEAHYNLTNDLIRLGRIDEAETLCLEEQALWPADARTQVDMGLLAMLRQDYDEAANRFRHALSLNPDEVFAHMNLVWIRAGQGRYQEANHHYAEVVRIVGPEKARRMSAPGIPGVPGSGESR